MDRTFVKQHFGLDKYSQESLVNQLSRRIEAFVSASVPGTQLPAERVMADELGISRVTVRNALAPFFHSGRILRQRRNGTVVAPKQMKKAGELALGLPWNVKPPRRCLRLLSYETLPQQMAFWNNAVDRFNESQEDITVELVPLSEQPQKTALLQKLVTDQNIDMLLYSPMFEQNYTAIVQELPGDLQEIFNTEPFIPQIAAGREQLCRYLLPISFEFCHTMWNLELAEKLGLKNVAQRLKNGEKIQMISEVGSKLPKDVWAGSHVWCQLAYHGVLPFVEKRAQLVSELERLASVSHLPRTFFTTQDNPLDDVEKFVRKQLLFLDAAFPLLQWVGVPSFRFCQVPCRQVEGGKLIMSSVEIGVTRRCPDPGAAAEFCRFLLTPEIQKSVETMKMVQPVRMAQYLEAMANQNGYSADESRELLKQSLFFRDMNHREELAQYFMIFEIRDELVELFRHTVSAEEAADKIIEKWQKFSAGRRLL